jgi:autotransporter translocation and assembly factor TamB
MRKALKLLGFLSATLVLFFVVASLAFYHLVRIGEVRRFFIDEIEKQTDLRVQLSGADLEIGWTTGIVFRDVTVRERWSSTAAISNGERHLPAVNAYGSSAMAESNCSACAANSSGNIFKAF